MDQYQQYVKKNQPTLILFLIVLCLVLIGGVAYDTVLLSQTKIQATQANNNAIAAGNDANQADSDAKQADSDAQQTDQDVENVCSAIGNLPDGSC